MEEIPLINRALLTALISDEQLTSDVEPSKLVISLFNAWQTGQVQDLTRELLVGLADRQTKYAGRVQIMPLFENNTGRVQIMPLFENDWRWLSLQLSSALASGLELPGLTTEVKSCKMLGSMIWLGSNKLRGGDWLVETEFYQGALWTVLDALTLSLPVKLLTKALDELSEVMERPFWAASMGIRGFAASFVADEPNKMKIWSEASKLSVDDLFKETDGFFLKYVERNKISFLSGGVFNYLNPGNYLLSLRALLSGYDKSVEKKEKVLDDAYVKAFPGVYSPKQWQLPLRTVVEYSEPRYLQYLMVKNLWGSSHLPWCFQSDQNTFNRGFNLRIELSDCGADVYDLINSALYGFLGDFTQESVKKFLSCSQSWAKSRGINFSVAFACIAEFSNLADPIMNTFKSGITPNTLMDIVFRAVLADDNFTQSFGSSDLPAAFGAAVYGLLRLPEVSKMPFSSRELWRDLMPSCQNSEQSVGDLFLSRCGLAAPLATINLSSPAAKKFNELLMGDLGEIVVATTGLSNANLKVPMKIGTVAGSYTNFEGTLQRIREESRDFKFEKTKRIRPLLDRLVVEAPEFLTRLQLDNRPGLPGVKISILDYLSKNSPELFSQLAQQLFQQKPIELAIVKRSVLVPRIRL